ncbi:MAG TPA: polyprenyl synthetase family protein [Mycobacteriales bacterium]
MTAVLPTSVDRARLLADPALRAAIARLHPTLAQVAAYHRGWVDADGAPAGPATGKALRPALALLGADAARVPASTALPAAVSVELVHDFSLLHDDLMDGDTERRHRPTAWTVFGMPAALLAGDGLLALAYRLLEESSAPGSAVAQGILAACVDRLVGGQADDLDFEHRLDVSYDDYLAMSAGKTGALLGAACCLGAALGGARAEQVAALAQYGEELGLAFQLVDDLLGIWGDPDVTGKPVLSDLRSRKKSAPIVLAAASSPRLRDYLRGEDADLSALAAEIETVGARGRVQDEVDAHVRRATAALGAADFDRRAVDELVRTADYVTGRDS